jgi:hypothetical protein
VENRKDVPQEAKTNSQRDKYAQCSKPCGDGRMTVAHYYYACSYPLAPGSVILKGNWGRICSLEAERLIEAIFERIRIQEFPDLPSRFNCNFLCPNLQSLISFVRTSNRPFDVLYEVVPVDPGAKRLETDWTLVRSSLDTAEMEQAARRYWNPQNVRESVKEILIESDIRIVNQVRL